MIAIIADGRWGRRIVHYVRERYPNEVVTWGVRSVALASELLMEETRVSVSSYTEAIKAHRLIIVAMPFQDLLPWADVYAPWLNGKIVIDLSIPQTSEDRLLFGWRTSGSEELQKKLPKSRVVGAKSAGIHRHTRIEQGVPSAIYVTSDDEEAKCQVIELFGGAGYQIVDAGTLEENRAIDRMISVG
ncbi:NADPH-dependent F420 reductase [Brevibacillus choshinensis]|uniref:NADPH-dependent F420 reductase n=1 Tax=Brevibacillus choshinensis TaxID=54911 RepID=UPI002E1A3E2E|nr:NAD(P)-binding domain-containing protein [Brevibacillus choshinensis]MED4752789.1 NAD(P)-binding domain-containing protein [Brevibacillus choshinensis]MED4781635.1 NAD(P)-binding domain-containing protein [Brevibacillus choshinensis]